MRHPAGTCIMLLFCAVVAVGALEPEPLTPPVGPEEYLEADDWFQVGLVMNSQGKYREAVQAFARSVSINPGNALSWLNLGTVQAIAGDFATAIGSLRESVRLDPKLALGFANLAEVYFRMERFREAAEAYGALLAIWPGNAHALYKRGLAYLALHAGSEAREQYELLRKADPELADKLRQEIDRGVTR